MPKIQEGQEIPKDDKPEVGQLSSYGKFAHRHEPMTTFFKDDVDLEAFMQEEVNVTVHESLQQGDVMAVPIIVGDSVQYVVRGVMTPVKRKYIEVLARARTTKWEQQQTNPYDPTSSRPVPRTALSYPFATHGDTPRGNAWLKAVLAQPN